MMAGSASGQNLNYFIHISIDGGGASYIQALIDNEQLPNFRRFLSEGAGTFNARSDYDYTVTLPNHVAQVTGRGVEGVDGHNWTLNDDPLLGQTIHTNKGSYVAGVFDVVHDNGLKTAMYTGKTKFSLFDVSYNAANGATDTTGVDNGPGKLDAFVYNGDTASLTNSFIADMQTEHFNYAFFHYADADVVGHSSGWGSNDYNNTLMAFDNFLGRVFDLVNSDAVLRNETAIVVTADHGGDGYDHQDVGNRLDYTIPFFVLGPGVRAGADLYALNSATRSDPGTERPPYSDPLQPIRNGDAANLELKMLSLPPIPGSTINHAQNLAVPEPTGLALLGAGLAYMFARSCFLRTRKWAGKWGKYP
jgi:hypothetical protein